MDFPSFLQHVPQLVLVSVRWLWMLMPVAQDKSSWRPFFCCENLLPRTFPSTFSLPHPRLLEDVPRPTVCVP